MFSENQPFSSSFPRKSLETAQKPTKSKRKIRLSTAFEPAKPAPPSTSSRFPAKPSEIPTKFDVKPELFESYLDEKTQTKGFSATKPTKKREFPCKRGEIPLISRDCREIVEQIARKPPQIASFSKQTGGKCNEILNKPSLKQKYEELVAKNTDFTLPSSYKSLLVIFEAIDQTLQFMKLRAEPQFLCFVRENLRLMGHVLTEKHVKQIVFLYPDAYNLNWEACKHAKNEVELHISLPGSENPSKSPVLEGRKAHFKRCLTDFVGKFHEEYLRNQGKCSKVALSLRENRVWDTDFPLEQAPEIPEGNFPKKPCVLGVKVQSLGDFLRKTEKKPRINEDLLRIIKETQGNRDEKEAVSKKMGISQRLLEKIKEKEQKWRSFSQETREFQGNSRDFIEKKKQKLRDFAEILKNHYTIKNVSNIFEGYLLDFLQSATTAHILSKEEIKELMELLLEICPYWVKRIANSQGNIIRMDRSVVLTRVFEEIKSFQRVSSEM